jgi:hypothetical protein
VSEWPIACTLQPDELARRGAELLPGIARRASSQQRIDNGHRYTFAASTECLTAIATMIDQERQCCRFLRFQLTVESDDGPVHLDVTGPSGTQEFLGNLLNGQD